MTLKHVRLEIARDPEFPNGGADKGYEFIAPLDDQGHLDAEEWQSVRERCRVRRFSPHEKDAIGHLIRRRGGSWAFDYDPGDTSDDEPGFKLDKHRIVPGEYISFREHDGVLRTFFIKSVVDLD